MGVLPSGAACAGEWLHGTRRHSMPIMPLDTEASRSKALRFGERLKGQSAGRQQHDEQQGERERGGRGCGPCGPCGPQDPRVGAAGAHQHPSLPPACHRPPAPGPPALTRWRGRSACPACPCCRRSTSACCCRRCRGRRRGLPGGGWVGRRGGSGGGLMPWAVRGCSAGSQRPPFHAPALALLRCRSPSAAPPAGPLTGVDGADHHRGSAGLAGARPVVAVAVGVLDGGARGAAHLVAATAGSAGRVMCCRWGRLALVRAGYAGQASARGIPLGTAPPGSRRTRRSRQTRGWRRTRRPRPSPCPRSCTAGRRCEGGGRGLGEKSGV